MSIFEYDEEKHMKSERKEWHEIGYREGHKVGINTGRKEGIETGSDNLAKLLQSLTEAGKTEEVNRLLNDHDYRQKLVKEYSEIL